MKSASCFQGVRAVLVTAAVLAPVAGAAQHVTEQIIVTATPDNRSTSEIAQSVTVVGGAELDRVRAATIGETLEGQLGMSASYFGAGASRPIIRGLAGSRVLTLVDGIEAMDASTVSADHAVGIDPVAARQLEIFRGPTSLLYGSGAVGGIVNTVTSRLPEAAPPDGLAGTMQLGANTVADERSFAAALDGGGQRLAWHLDAADRSADDYEIPGLADLDEVSGLRRVLANSDIDLTSYAVGASWLGDDALFGVAVSGLESNYGIPGHEHGPDAAPVRIDLRQSRVDLKGRWRPGGVLDTVDLRVGVSDYEHQELEGGSAGTRFGNRGYEARAELGHSPAALWSGVFGVQLVRRDFSAIGEEAFVPPVASDGYGLFVLERRDTEVWSVSLGARYERLQHDPTAADSFAATAASFSAAAIRSFASGFSMAFNLASAERVPSAEELYSYGPHLATESFEIGNPNLAEETARHLDASLRRDIGSRRWSVNAYRTHYDRFIFLRDTGALDPDDSLPVHVYAQQDADFYGVEAEIFAPIATVGPGELDLRVFADFVRARLADGTNVPRIPPRRAGARLSWHADRVALGFEIIRYGDQQRVAPFESPTPGYTAASTDVDWLLEAGGSIELTLFARASNLLDEDARRHTSFVKEIAPLPGRNLTVGLRAAF